MDAAEPIPMLLRCPLCGLRHIDEGDFATKPHTSHSCQLCGHTWRPAVVATVGVLFLPGFKNECDPPKEPLGGTDDERHERGYIEGRRRTLLNQLREAVSGLVGLGLPVPPVATLTAERQEAVARLRGLCADHGDNDWDDEDHLADVVDRLGKYLAERPSRRKR